MSQGGIPPVPPLELSHLHPPKMRGLTPLVLLGPGCERIPWECLCWLSSIPPPLAIPQTILVFSLEASPRFVMAGTRIDPCMWLLGAVLGGQRTQKPHPFLT